MENKWRILHWIIILWFLGGIIYSGYQWIFVLNPGFFGILGTGATEITFEEMVTRRLYAMEAWIEIIGLVIYLALTEFVPRQKRTLENR